MASAQELLHEQTALPAAQPGEGPKKRGRIKFPKLKRKRDKIAESRFYDGLV